MAFGKGESGGGFLDKIFKLPNIDEEDDYDEDDDYIFDEEDDDDDYDEPVRAPRKKAKPEPKPARSGFGRDNGSQGAGYNSAPAASNKRYTSVSRTATDNLVSFNNRDNKASKASNKNVKSFYKETISRYKKRRKANCISV